MAINIVDYGSGHKNQASLVGTGSGTGSYTFVLEDHTREAQNIRFPPNATFPPPKKKKSKAE